MTPTQVNALATAQTDATQAKTWSNPATSKTMGNSGTTQVFDAITTGITTLTSAVTNLVRAVGATLVLRSSTVGVKLGTETADGSYPIDQSLFSLALGIGGSETEALNFKPNPTPYYAMFNVNMRNKTNALLLDITNMGAGEGGQVKWTTAYGYTRIGYLGAAYSGIDCTNRPIRLITNNNVENTTALEGFLFWSKANPTRAVARVVGPSTQTAPLFVCGFDTGVDKAQVTAAGEFESLVSGSGVVLKSPNGTRWRVTVDNSGALSVAAA